MNNQLAATGNLIRREFGRPAYVAALVVALTAGLVTRDGALVAGLVSALVLLRGLTALRYRLAPEVAPKERELLNRPDQVALIGVSFAGVVLVILFGFGKHLFFRAGPELSHTEGWEVGALIWTGVCWLVYFFKIRTDHPALEKTVELAFLVAGCWFGSMAWQSLHQPRQHVAWVVGIAGILLLMDVLLAAVHKDEEKKNHYWRTALIADVPIVIGLTVLLVYARVHPDAEHQEIFFSGAISLQFIVTNVIFLICELGLLDF